MRHVGPRFCLGLSLWFLLACSKEPHSHLCEHEILHYLRTRLELARSDRFHLVLEPGLHRLELRLRGALLREYRVLRITRPMRRIAFFSLSDDLTWLLPVHERGRLEPERPTDRYEVEVRPGDPDSEVPPVRIPPPPEEAIPAPPSFLIQFEDGLDIVVASESVAREHGTTSFWNGVLEALGLAPFPARRLLVVLQDAEAAALYRSLPQDILLVISPVCKYSR